MIGEMSFSEKQEKYSLEMTIQIVKGNIVL